MGELKGGALFPTYPRFPLSFQRGEGSWLWDEQGKKYLDLMCGIAVTNLGHAPAAVKAKVQEQLDRVWHVSNLFEIPSQQRLGELLAEVSGLKAAFFCNSGAEANEGAIKLARRYQQRIAGNDRYEIITFKQSFHGRTLATLTATGQDKVKDGFAPLPEGFVTVPYNDAQAVREAVTDRTAAVMLELVQGEGGVVPADSAFVQELSKLCKEQGLLLIIDEIQTGVGRTGRMFAYQHYGIEPDIVTLAKGLGSGFPIGAVLGAERVVEAFGPGTHGTTFGGNPIVTTAALATIEEMIDGQWPLQAERLGHETVTFLRERLSSNDWVREVRGLGLMIGIECAGPVADVITEAREAGVLVIPAGPNVVRLLPALNIDETALKDGLEKICALLDQRAAVGKETTV